MKPENISFPVFFGSCFYGEYNSSYKRLLSTFFSVLHCIYILLYIFTIMSRLSVMMIKLKFTQADINIDININ